MGAWMRSEQALLCLLVAVGLAAPGGRAGAQQAGITRPSLPVIDTAQLLLDTRVLAADSMEGRRAGTAGGGRARRYILAAYQRIGLARFPSGYLQSFPLQRGAGSGMNVIGYLRGHNLPDRYIVLTAHYDHLGTRNGQIYHGADDNASGTAGLLALARYFRRHPPAHSLLFVATDAEEEGLQGARAFVRQPPVPRDAMLIDINLDMISHNDRNELYVAGTHQYPAFLPIVRAVAAETSIHLLPGHDRPGLPPGDDWTNESDQGAFHAAGIPFLYFGVEDHPDYHRPTDTFDRINQGFFVRAVRVITEVVRRIDAGE